jgi:flagellar assembly protein FliH
LSKVIKFAQWQETPRSIEAPPAPSKPVEAEEEPEVDEEAVARLLEEIAQKEQRAKDLLKEAEKQAALLKQEGQAEYDRLMEEARAEIEAAKEEARGKGYEEGLQQGRVDGEKEIRQSLQDTINETNAKAEKTLRDAEEATFDYLQKAEEDVVSIAMGVVEKVLPQHFIDVPQMVLPLVREAILKVKDQKKLVVHVPPTSYDFVLMARDELRQILTAGDALLEIHSDEALKPGDCLVETPNGSVDARLATQMELIKQAVLDVMM